MNYVILQIFKNSSPFHNKEEILHISVPYKEYIPVIVQPMCALTVLANFMNSEDGSKI
jgi:hypothetical protein